MLMEVKHNIKFIIKSIQYNLLSAMEYKKSFFTQVIFMFINNGFFLVFWNVVFGINQGNVNGIEMRDIYLLWSIPTIGWGTANFFFGGVRELSRYIITGSLDTYLLQPKNLFFSIATSKCDFSALGDLIYGICIGILASNSIIDFLLILLFGMLASIFIISSIVMIRSLAIWIGDVENIAHIYEESLLINLSTYPEQIFGKTMEFLLYTIIPAAYIIHVPIKIMKQFNGYLLLLICIVAVIYVIIAYCFLKKGLEKYESGNNIALKM